MKSFVEVLCEGLDGARRIGAGRAVAAAAALLLAGMVGPVGAQTVDGFDVDQATVFNNTSTKTGSSTSGAGILGGERDVAVTDNSPGGLPVSIGVSDGRARYAALASTSDGEIVWDGSDGDPINLDATGLGGVDLTAGGAADAFVVIISEWANAPQILFRVYTDAANWSTFTLPFTASVTSATPFILPFSGFTTSAGTGADFTAVGAVAIHVSATFDANQFESLDTGLAAPELTATKTDALVDDVDSDGQIGPGDTVRYTVVVTNSGLEDATGVTFSSDVDAASALLVGSVSTTEGSVTTGNTPGDTSVAVQVGTLAAGGGSATIEFEVVVADPLPLEVVQLSCQGTVASNELADLSTDDPDTAAPADPTLTPLLVPPAAITATKTDALLVDLDGNGFAGPGETVRYTVQIVNGGDGSAGNVSFASSVPTGSTLDVGSVSTSHGSVLTGNNPADTAVVVAVGTLLAGGDTATIVFDVVVTDPLAEGLTELVCQGLVTASDVADVATDDPDTDAIADATVTPVVFAPNVVEIPTISTLGVLILTLLLALGGVLRLRSLA